ncbi:hypothetical protein DPMN_001840 [Dreissena polymorpha]|uniref:Uncharacterized protein n=1 Tax=Dreissena polymorpha TaxID=45954 RepID=A0A9D4MM18_DREPO|nr:hypothetical protein DPMN_001840 [Dreissena polymorpha]
MSSANLKLKDVSAVGDGGVVLSEGFLHYLLKKNVKQDGGYQTSLTDNYCCPDEITHLPVKTNSTDDVSLGSF